MERFLDGVIKHVPLILTLLLMAWVGALDNKISDLQSQMSHPATVQTPTASPSLPTPPPVVPPRPFEVLGTEPGVPIEIMVAHSGNQVSVTSTVGFTTPPVCEYRAADDLTVCRLTPLMQRVQTFGRNPYTRWLFQLSRRGANAVIRSGVRCYENPALSRYELGFFRADNGLGFFHDYWDFRDSTATDCTLALRGESIESPNPSLTRQGFIESARDPVPAPSAAP